MQYKIPQNIDLEDKIIGPFTMKQFLYLLVSGAIIYGWWNYLNNLNKVYYVNVMPYFLLLALPIGLIGFCFAVVKINDRAFPVFLLGVFKFLFSPKKRVWTDGYKPKDTIIIKAESGETANKKPRDMRSLDDLAKSLEAQSAAIRAEQDFSRPKTGKETVSQINLSVKDVDTAAKKQAKAQK